MTTAIFLSTGNHVVIVNLSSEGYKNCQSYTRRIWRFGKLS